jgi:hypothetical protein
MTATSAELADDLAVVARAKALRSQVAAAANKIEETRQSSVKLPQCDGRALTRR